MAVTDPDLIRTASAGDAQSYDFARPRSLSDRQIEAAQSTHAAFADGLAVALSDALGESAWVQASSLDDVPVADFQNSRSRPTAFFDLRLGTSGPPMGLDLAPALALFLVERHLGGSDPIREDSRALSNLETAVVEGVWLPLIGTVFAETWGTIPPAPAGFTWNPDDIGQAMPSDRILVTDLEVTVGETSAILSLAYPIDTIRVLLEIVMSHSAASDAQASRSDSVAVDTVPVHLRAELGRTQLSVQEILSLLPGDVIPLDSAIADPIPVWVGDGLHFEARTGVSGKRIALRLLTPPTPPPHHG
ncbi:MAG: FliM/FliN family flagellar motor switch protein [Bacteroidota bacterium]